MGNDLDLVQNMLHICTDIFNFELQILKLELILLNQLGDGLFFYHHPHVIQLLHHLVGIAFLQRRSFHMQVTEFGVVPVFLAFDLLKQTHAVAQPFFLFAVNFLNIFNLPDLLFVR